MAGDGRGEGMKGAKITARLGDYVLATKFHDGDPGDHWAIGFFTGILPKCTGDRYMVADIDGNQFRGNGFRRVKKINSERGRWLLEHREDITGGVRSLWWWVRASMERERGG